jgi:hypothetical protein
MKKPGMNIVAAVPADVAKLLDAAKDKWHWAVVLLA